MVLPKSDGEKIRCLIAFYKEQKMRREHETHKDGAQREAAGIYGA